MEKLQHLPVYSSLEKIKSLIDGNMITHVTIPTGCGKSIGIPFILAMNGMKVFCTQPTIPSVLGLYSYQKDLYSANTVGWSAEGTRKFTKHSQIVYCTAGYMRKRLLEYFKRGSNAIDCCDVLMVDEIHTGNRDNSLILDLWLYAHNKGMVVPRLVLATATDHGIGNLKVQFPGASFVANFRYHDIEERFTTADYDIDSEECFKDAAARAIELLVEKQSHGIVFCSGSSECEDMMDLIQLELKECSKEFGKPVKVLPCFAQCKPEQILEAIEPCNEFIKIVCATNVVESSLTIPDIAWVVDLLSEKRSTVVNGKFQLAVSRISKNSAIQRKGRTGRTLDGCVCQFMCTKEFFSTLEHFKPLEILNMPISDMIIELFDANISPGGVISQLDLGTLCEAIRVLEKCKCIEYTNGRIHVTNCGRFVSAVPMNVENASSFYHYATSCASGNFYWPLVWHVMIDTFGPSLFWLPRKKKEEKQREYQVRLREYIEDHFEQFMGKDPLHSLVSIYYEFTYLFGHDFGRMSVKDKRRIADWSWSHSINHKKLREISLLISRLQRIIEGFHINVKFVEIEKIDLDIIRNNVNCHLFATFSERMLKETHRGYVNDNGGRVAVDRTKTVFHQGIHCDCRSILSLSEILLQTVGGSFLLSSLWIPQEVSH